MPGSVERAIGHDQAATLEDAVDDGVCEVGIVRAYPRERKEIVFDAHERAFAFVKGACERGIYDNMKTAGASSPRYLTERRAPHTPNLPRD